MNRAELIKFLGNDWNKVQKCISDALDTDIEMLRALNEELLSHSGKQLRPMLCLLMARACRPENIDGLPRESICYAAAAELLHNATLIHDDVADSSDCRRGHPTVLSLIGPSAAVLLGDFWLARAVETFNRCNYDERIHSLFTKTLGDLSQGEMLQLEKADKADTSIDDYLRIIYCKTGSLFETACVSGAVSASASPRFIEAARSFSRYLGLAFQIKDDILDYVGNEEIGKPLGSDLREHKITLPLLGALVNNPSQEFRVRSLLREGSDPATLESIRSFVLENGGVAYAQGVLDDYVRKAEDSLSVFPPSEAREYLLQLAQYNSTRTL